MCGIVGVWHLDGRRVVEADLAAARDLLVHRGPDDAGLHIDGSLGLGHRRLSIIDLSPLGRMPMSNEAGDVWAVFNGEIYNFAVLRTELEGLGHRFRSHTDSEVIVHAYEEWGDDSIARFDGMFALAIWDATRRRLVLARDITGEKPLFYAHASGRHVVFGSTVDAVLGFGLVPREMEATALRKYIGFGFVPGPDTIIRGVRKVEPGSVVVFESDGEPRSRRYWSLETVFEQPRRAISLEQATDELHALLRDVVHSRLVADVPLGAFLSGGIDSSLVVALMAERQAASVRTFTVGFREAAYDESEHAHRIAKHLGVENTMIVLDAQDVLRELPAVTRALDEPMADYSVLPSLAVARVARRHVTVALTGDGADEAFGGYRYYVGTRAFERFASAVPLGARRVMSRLGRAVPQARIRRAVERSSVPDTATFFGRSGFYRGATASGSVARILDGAGVPADEEVAEFVRAHSSAGATEAGMLWDATHTLPDAWLNKVDRTSMAVSLETRAPFLARSVLEYAFSLPLDFRVHGLQKKVILRRILGRYLPEALYERPKQGFTAPLRTWFAGALRDELHDRLSPERLARYGMFKPAAVQELLAEQRARTADHTQLLWALFLLDRWRDAHLDRG